MDGWLLVLPAASLPELTGEMLEEVVRRTRVLLLVVLIGGVGEVLRFFLLPGLISSLAFFPK